MSSRQGTKQPPTLDPQLQVTALQREKEQLQSQLNTANSRLKIFERDSTLKQRKIEEIQYQLDRSMTSSQQEINLDRLTEDDEKRRLKQQVLDLQQQIKQLQNKPLDFDKEISKSVIQRESLHSDVSSANQIIKQQQNTISELQNKLKLQNSLQVDTTNQHILDLQDRLTKLQIQADKQVIEINELNKQKLQFLKDVDFLQNQVNAQQLSSKQEQSENELRYSKESQRMSLTLTNKDSAIQTTEQKLKQAQEYLYQLQRKYDQDTLQLKTNLQDADDQIKRLTDQLNLQGKLLEQVQNEKAQLSNMYEKLQTDANSLSFQLQQQIKNGESKYLRDSSTLQQLLTERDLRILDLEKGNRELNDKVFLLQQQLDKDAYNYNSTIKDLQDKISRLTKALDDKTLQFNQLLEEKQLLNNTYLRLQEEIGIQKLRYQQELSKNETQYNKEIQYLQQQLQDRGSLISELEAKIKSLNELLTAFQKRYDQETQLNNQHVSVQDDQLRNLQEQLDQKSIQNNNLNQEKALLNSQFDRLQQNYNNLKQQYNDDVSKLNEEVMKQKNLVNQKQQQILQLENNNRKLNEELLQTQVRFEKEINLANLQIQQNFLEIAQLNEQLRKEQQLNKDWEQQNQNLKNQVSQQMDDLRKMTELQLTEKYQQLTNEQKSEFNILMNSLNAEKQQLKQELNQKVDKIRSLENQVQELILGTTKNQILISELQTSNQQQKFQINEQEAKIRELINQEFDSIRDKTADQQLRNLMSEVKILQQKLKKSELYASSLEAQLLKK